MIWLSVLMYVLFSYQTADSKEQLKETTSFAYTFNYTVWLFTSMVWSSYVYIQELEKKTQFVNGHKRVKSYQKLKVIHNLLVPSVVRDRKKEIKLGKKNILEEEGEVTIIVIVVDQFEQLYHGYNGSELLTLLDSVFNTFDQYCEMYGLQIIE